LLILLLLQSCFFQRQFVGSLDLQGLPPDVRASVNKVIHRIIEFLTEALQIKYLARFSLNKAKIARQVPIPGPTDAWRIPSPSWFPRPRTASSIRLAAR
jgi:hypothetical protein